MQTLQSSFSSVYSNYYNFFKFFPRELGLIVRDITSDGCAAKDGRLQVSNFSMMFFNSSLFLYYPLPFPRPQVHRLFFSFCCFTPICLFPYFGAWSQANATALRILVNMKMRYIYLVGERCKT